MKDFSSFEGEHYSLATEEFQKLCSQKDFKTGSEVNSFTATTFPKLLLMHYHNWLLENFDIKPKNKLENTIKEIDDDLKAYHDKE